METLRPLVEEKPVAIFSSSSTDPVSHSMNQLFSGYGANPTVYVLKDLPNKQEVENALQIVGQQSPSVPAIFIGGNFIGGPNEVIGLQVRGELVQKLIDARAIWFWNRDR